MKCTDLQPLQGAYLDSELDAKTTLEIQQHLAACPNCARAFAADAKLDARIVAGLKRGQRTAALWAQIERRVAVNAASVSDSIGRSGDSAERRNLTPTNAIWRRSAESPLRNSETVPAKVGSWWRELLWPNPQAWAGLAALWVMMLAISLSAHEPATVAEAQKVTPPSPQLRQMLREQKQLLAELGGVAEQLGDERPGRVAPQPRSQKREPLINI